MFTAKWHLKTNRFVYNITIYFQFYALMTDDGTVRVDQYCLGVVVGEQLQLMLCDQETSKQAWNYYKVVNL